MDHTSDFVRLWTRHQAEVGRYVFMMIPGQADAAEVLQDVSVLLRKKAGPIRPRAPLCSVGNSLCLPGSFEVEAEAGAGKKGSIKRFAGNERFDGFASPGNINDPYRALQFFGDLSRKDSGCCGKFGDGFW
jgi:hypothetical protein